MSKAKTPKPAKGTGRKLKYDPDRILKLWEGGKSIRQIADAMKPISKVFVHRTLTTKFSDQYTKEQAKRAATREAARDKAAK
ncbi:MAG: helix-turn-helix domain-containing protein [Candidatus Acidiferrum sp.]